MKHTNHPDKTAAPVRGDRSPGNTVTSFSISRKILDEGKLIADEENRTFSNFVAVLIEREIMRRKRLREKGEG